MASLLTRKLVSLSYLFPSSVHHNLSILTPLFHLSTEIKQKGYVPFMAQYLVSSFGFSQERALRVASERRLSSIKTPDRPESVVRFLKDTGLTDVQIKQAVSLRPPLLAKSVSKTLELRAREVITAGFTRETLIHLIQYNPDSLSHNNLVSRLQFWRNYFGSEDAFQKFTKKWGVLSLDIDTKAVPIINLLKEQGLSDIHITTLLTMAGNFLHSSRDSINSSFEELDKLGVPRGSKKFVDGLRVLVSIKKDTFYKKMALFKTYGWSHEDIILAFKMYPNSFALSEENVSSTMDFLITKVGLNPRRIALWPPLLGYSLKRRLIPRHYVLSLLSSKGLKSNINFYTMFTKTEERFFEEIILPHMEELPDLKAAYNDARDGKIPCS